MTSHFDAWPRTIAHADMDAFYAAVEQLDDPSLRGRPLLVGVDHTRGVVLTASYEARQFGCASAMPMQRAKRLCPDALVVPPRFERYQEISKCVMDVFATFSPQVEALSLDEAFIDLTGASRLLGTRETIGKRIKDGVREATGGLTASVGISGTRYVAKVASGHQKPDGLTIVPPDAAREWLAPMPVSSLWGAGAKTVQRLHELGFRTIGQIATANVDTLTRSLGALGQRFHALANAVDPRGVDGERRTTSVGCERTLSVDVKERAEIERHLRAATDTVAARLRRRSAAAHGVRVKLKRFDFRLLTRQSRFEEPTDVAAVLFARARPLLDEIVDDGPFRLVGFAAYDLGGREDGAQLELVPEAGQRSRRLETVIDSLVERFGPGIVQRAADLGRERDVGAPANLDFLHDKD